MNKKYIGYGERPSDKDFFKITKTQYDAQPEQNIGNYELILNTPTVKAYLDRPSETIVLSIRGTTDGRDVTADTMIPFNRLKYSNRYNEDKNIITSLINQYPPNDYDYYGTGHSLGSALLRQLQREFPFIKDTVTFNGAVQPYDIVDQKANLNKSYYTEDDALYKLGGRLLNNKVVIPSTVHTLKLPSVLPTPAPVKVGSFVYNASQGHKLDNFEGVLGGAISRMREKLQKMTVKEIKEAVKNELNGAIKGYSKMKKEDLIDAIRDYQKNKKGSKKSEEPKITPKKSEEPKMKEAPTKEYKYFKYINEMDGGYFDILIYNEPEFKDWINWIEKLIEKSKKQQKQGSAGLIYRPHIFFNKESKGLLDEAFEYLSNKYGVKEGLKLLDKNIEKLLIYLDFNDSYSDPVGYYKNLNTKNRKLFGSIYGIGKSEAKNSEKRYNHINGGSCCMCHIKDIVRGGAIEERKIESLEDFKTTELRKIASIFNKFFKIKLTKLTRDEILNELKKYIYLNESGSIFVNEDNKFFSLKPKTVIKEFEDKKKVNKSKKEEKPKTREQILQKEKIGDLRALLISLGGETNLKGLKKINIIDRIKAIEFKTRKNELKEPKIILNQKEEFEKNENYKKIIYIYDLIIGSNGLQKINDNINYIKKQKQMKKYDIDELEKIVEKTEELIDLINAPLNLGDVVDYPKFEKWYKNTYPEDYKNLPSKYIKQNFDWIDKYFTNDEKQILKSLLNKKNIEYPDFKQLKNELEISIKKKIKI